MRKKHENDLMLRRNEKIYKMWLMGKKLKQIAARFQLSISRVHRIVNDINKKGPEGPKTT